MHNPEMNDPAELGPIADRVLFENERVRIWEMQLEPGERTPVHHHEHDYVVILVEGDRVGVEAATGSKFESDGYRESQVVPGKTVFIRGGGTETAMNVGKTTYRDIEIELL